MHRLQLGYSQISTLKQLLSPFCILLLFYIINYNTVDIRKSQNSFTGGDNNMKTWVKHRYLVRKNNGHEHFALRPLQFQNISNLLNSLVDNEKIESFGIPNSKTQGN